MSKTTIIGREAGDNLTLGCRNVLIGPRAGKYLTSESDMVILNDLEGNEVYRKQDAELSKALRENVLPYLETFFGSVYYSEIEELNEEIKELENQLKEYGYPI